jgi:integrase
MPSIRRKENSPYWFAVFRDGAGKQKQKSTGIAHDGGSKARRSALRMAEEWEAAARGSKSIRAMLSAGREMLGAGRDSTTVKAFAKTWIETAKADAKAGLLAKDTPDSYAPAINRFVAFLGDRADADIATVSKADVAAWRGSLANVISSGTARKYVKILRSMFSDAEADGLTLANPAAAGRRSRRERKAEQAARTTSPRRAFTADELRRVLAVAPAEWQGLILAGMTTGGRLGDLARLQWSAVDLAAGEIAWTASKTGQRVALPLHPALIAWMGARPAAERKPGLPLFPTLAAALVKRGRVSVLSNDFHGLLVAAGLAEKRTHHKREECEGRGGRRRVSPLSFHGLRHFAAQAMRAAGVPEIHAMNVLGHETAAVHRTYGKGIGADALRAAIHALPDLTPTAPAKASRRRKVTPTAPAALPAPANDAQATPAPALAQASRRRKVANVAPAAVPAPAAPAIDAQATAPAELASVAPAA